MERIAERFLILDNGHCARPLRSAMRVCKSFEELLYFDNYAEANFKAD